MTLLNVAQQVVRTGSLGGYVYARNQAAGWAPGPGQFSMQVGNARIPINKTDGEGIPFPLPSKGQVCSFYYGGTLVEEKPIDASLDGGADTCELRFSSAWTQLLDGLTYRMRIDGAPVDPSPSQPQMAKKVHLGGEQVWPASKDGLAPLILSHNPLNYWPCDESSGDLVDLGSRATPLTPTGTPWYGETVGSRRAVAVKGLTDIFNVSPWDFPSTPLTILVFTQPDLGVLDVRGHASDEKRFTMRCNSTNGAVGDAGRSRWDGTGAFITSTVGNPPGVALHAFTHDGTDGTHHIRSASVNTSRSGVRTWNTDTSRTFGLIGAWDRALACHVAVIPSVLSDADLDALWAAF